MKYFRNYPRKSLMKKVLPKYPRNVCSVCTISIFFKYLVLSQY